MCNHYTANADYAGAAERYRNQYGTGGFSVTAPAPEHCELCGATDVEFRMFGSPNLYRACADVTACEERRAKELVKNSFQFGEGWPE